MRSSESIAALSDALVKANLLIVNPTKDQTVSTGRYSYRYVGLDTVLAEIRPVLQAHQLALVQELADDGVRTRLIHESGEWLEFGPLTMPAGEDAQSRGSAITYARRYQVLAALGLHADEDDDGKKASPVPHASPAAFNAPATAENEATRASTGDTVRGGGAGLGEGRVAAPSDAPSDGGSGVAGLGETSAAAAPPSDALAALLEAVDGSEVRAINAVNKAMHTAYKASELETLEVEDWAAGYAQVKGGK